MRVFWSLFILIVSAATLSCQLVSERAPASISSAQNESSPGADAGEDAPGWSDTFTPVQPVETQRAAAQLQIGQGRFFSYALPEGWRVGEDGQFALTLVAPDNRALTIMVGNSGLPVSYPPAQFVYEKFAALRPESLQIGQGRPARPVAGFAQAVEFDVAYVVQGIPSRGVAKCNINTAYDTAVMAMTAAVSDATQWPGYSTWLPQVADQVSATNGAAFGIRGVMAQNLQNSMAYAEAARNYREWSQNNWQQVTNQRNESIDRRNEAFRESLGGVQTYRDPYNSSRSVELPQTYKHYWVNQHGQYVGTDDPGADPNYGSTDEWRRMDPRR